MSKVDMLDKGIRIRHYLFEDQEADVVHHALFRELCLGTVRSYPDMMHTNLTGGPR